jgi:uncharacterized protein (DUF4415 family)
MRKKKERIVSYTLAELRKMKSRTDWKKAASMPVPDGSDPDDAMSDDNEVDWVTTTLPMPQRKEHTNLRIDADVMQFFRKQGKGYQTKINAVLRSYVEQIAGREKH